MLHKKIRFILLFLMPAALFGQEFLKTGNISGNFQIDAQIYNTDSKLGISDSTLGGRRFGLDGYGKLDYSNGNFMAGMRYESYLGPIQGIDQKFEGSEIHNWYAEFKNDNIDITIGDFYDQFGSGMILRSYEEWNLGYDNSLKGMRVKFNPSKGIYLKGLVGVHRYFWIPFEDNNRGIVKGFDAEFALNDIFRGLKDSKTRINLGGSIVSKYEKVKPLTEIRTVVSFDTVFTTTDTLIYQITDKKTYEYQLPYNVFAWAGRFSVSRGKLSWTGEFVQKYRNPSAFNNFIYRIGHGALSSISYSRKGLGIIVTAKRTDNMSFKSKMTQTGNDLDINFLPPLTKQHHYSLAAMYPYATQPNGEMGLQGQIDFTVPKDAFLGGTNFSVNYSLANSIEKTPVNDTTVLYQPGTEGYQSDFFAFGDEKYFEDFNIQVTKKFSKSWKGIFTYACLTYNNVVTEGHETKQGGKFVYANVCVADITWKVDKKNALRLETQALFARQDEGDWIAGLFEYTISPKWFFTVADEYNYGNDESGKRLHYFNIATGYIKNTTRIALSYGRQREGLLCVGGVCRQVPAATGLTLTITSSF
jgi:hypothetical protein